MSSRSVYIARDGWLKDARDHSSIRPASDDEIQNHAVSARFELELECKECSRPVSGHHPECSSAALEEDLEPWEIVETSGAFYVQRADGSELQPRRYYVKRAAEELLESLERADEEARA